MYRIINVSRPHLVVSGGTTIVQQPLTTSVYPKTITEMIQSLHGKGTVVINSGVYQENVIVPNGVNLYGNGIVKIDGSLTLEGEGSVSNVDSRDMYVKGQRLVEKSEVKTIYIFSGYLGGSGMQIGRIISNNGQFSLRNSVLGRTVLDYTLNMTHSTGIIESSTLEGPSLLKTGSVLDCRQSSIVGGNEDLFETEDETVTLQMFNCTVFGERLIKSGPGTSIRANVIALSEAREFEGGENTKLESI